MVNMNYTITPDIEIDVNKHPILNGVVNGIINIDSYVKQSLENIQLSNDELDKTVVIIIYDKKLYKIISVESIFHEVINDSRIVNKTKINNKNSIFSKVVNIASTQLVNSMNHNSPIAGDVVLAINKQLQMYIGIIRISDTIMDNTIEINR